MFPYYNLRLLLFMTCIYTILLFYIPAVQSMDNVSNQLQLNHLPNIICDLRVRCMSQNVVDVYTLHTLS